LLVGVELVPSTDEPQEQSDNTSKDITNFFMQFILSSSSLFLADAKFVI